jgi:thiamine biosynthesis protein ThiS
MERLGCGDPHRLVKLRVNGEEHVVKKARNIADLIAELGLPAPAMLVEHNGVALRRNEWDRALAEGDRLEIVRIVAGG